MADSGQDPTRFNRYEAFDETTGQTYEFYLQDDRPEPVGSASFKPYKAPRSSSRRRRSGIGPGSVLLAIVIVAVFGAWHFGLIDRMAYEWSLAQADENASAVSPVSASSAGGEAGGEPQTALPYAYSTLSDDDQRKYRIVLSAIETREPQPYPVNDVEDLSRIHEAVKADHPELFGDGGMKIESVTNRGSGIVERVTIEGDFICTAEKEAATRALADERVASCLAALPAGADDYETAKHLYEWLAANVSYDQEAANNDSDESGAYAYAQSIEGALVEGHAVCAGYAKAFAYLMQSRGLQCVVVTGTADDGDHAWCIARLDGDYYCIDPTWGDLQLDGYDSGFVNYDYLNVSDDVFLRTHAPNTSFELPSCTATADNYYVREGLVLGAADEALFGELAAAALAKGRPFQARGADGETYLELRSFAEGGTLFRYLAGSDIDMLPPTRIIALQFSPSIKPGRYNAT